MGTDSVGPFDKKLCDRIIALNGADLPGFIDSMLPNFAEVSILRFGFVPGASGMERLQELTRQGLDLTALQRELVQELCPIGERIPVDYWGCFVEVFPSGKPPGAVSDLVLFSNQQEEHFLLLRPENVARMIENLRTHVNELTVMTSAEVEQLDSWRERCSQDPGLMVAYYFDV